MTNRFFSLIFFLLAYFLATSTVCASSDKLWTDVSSSIVSNKSNQARRSSVLPLLPERYRLLRLDETAMLDTLSPVVNDSRPSARKLSLASSSLSQPLELPLPSGESIFIQVTESNILAPDLAEKYPSIQTFTVKGNDNKGIYGSIDMTPLGFHAMLFMSDGRRLFIDPRRSLSDHFYISYYEKDYHPAEKKPLQCSLDGSFIKKDHVDKAINNPVSTSLVKNITASKTANRAGNVLRTYRLALAATAEYTAFHGGTIEGALSAMTTTISRVNTIYERDLAIKLELVANTDLLISTDSTAYSNSDGAKMLVENQIRIDAIIGSQHYDIGHVVSTGGGGIASLATVCGSHKARGVTGSPQPLNDAFDIDFVAHEMGHQLGGRHTFNSDTGNCGGGNRTPNLAVEPGSGSTILAYAGLCGNNNVQANSDATFHIKSIEEISRFVEDSNAGASCGVTSPTINNPPIANAGRDYIIPPNTPFELTGSGSDPDRDIISYSWEQVDVGDASDINVDTLNNAIFRTFLPKRKPSRVFPKMASILKGNSMSQGEVLPIAARALNFKLAVRDGNGGVVSDAMKITVVNSGAFEITSHMVTETLSAGSLTNLTWNVAGTNLAPVNCPNVSVSLTTDDGKTFINALSSTPNDGSQAVRIPSNIADSATARFRIKCNNNIFFDISEANLVTRANITVKAPVFSNAGSNNILDPGESVQLSIPLQNNGNRDIINLSGTLSTTNQSANLLSRISEYPDIQPNGQAVNTTPYQINLTADAECGADLPLSLFVGYSQGFLTTNTINFSIPIGIGTQTNAISQAIPDNNSTGLTSQVTVTGFGSIPNPQINLDLDIVHTFRGDLAMKLTSPQGTTVQLTSFNGRNNGTAFIGNFPTDFTPEQSLSAFDGENLDGIWELSIVDSAARDTGILNNWSLHFKSAACDGSVNTSPTVSNSSLTTIEATAISGALQASDIDNNPLTYTLLSTGTKGTAVLTSAATGTFTYTPVAGQTGQDRFTFNVSDGAATSIVGTVNILINPKPNSAPVANNSSFTTIESTGVNGTLQASDADSNPLTYSLVSNGTKGTAVITNATTGAFSYTPESGQIGQDTLTFNVSDGTATSATATVNITITPATPIPNTIPTVTNGSISTIEATAITGLLQASDADNDPLTYSIVSNATKGSAVITNTSTGAFTYTPAAGQTGNDSFVFTVSDGTDTSSNATLSISITADIQRGVDVSPVSYLFGQQELGGQTPAKSFTVKNTGSETIDISTVELIGSHAGQFTILTENCINQSLAPNTTCTVSANFQPTSIGSKSAQLQINTSDPDNSVILVFLSNHEADEEESARRIPPILSSFAIVDSSNNRVDSLQSNTQYTIEWSILGYHQEYDSSVALFNCTGIEEATSCGNSLSDSARFILAEDVASQGVTNGGFSINGIQSKDHKFEYVFTTPNLATSTPIVIRLYWLNKKDAQAGNEATPLIIPGGHSIDYYDTTGHRIKHTIAP